MRLVITVNTKDPETAWNALRLGIAAPDAGHKVRVLLPGDGVEIESIRDEEFDIVELLTGFGSNKASLSGCGTCMGLRWAVEAAR
jgi:uncharacterized protein involved in oxidation of intracellular sulfur